jgi:hypothetical protein
VEIFNKKNETAEVHYLGSACVKRNECIDLKIYYNYYLRFEGGFR